METDSEGFRQYIDDNVREFIDSEIFSEQIWQQQVSKAYYMQGDFRDGKTYQNLKELLAEIDGQTETPDNYLFYCVNCVNLETNQFTCIHLIHLIIIFTTNIFYDKGLIIIKF